MTEDRISSAHAKLSSRDKLLKEVEQFSITDALNKDESIPEYAKLMINQLNGLLKLATEMISTIPVNAVSIEDYRNSHSVVLANLPESTDLNALPTMKATYDLERASIGH